MRNSPLGQGLVAVKGGVVAGEVEDEVDAKVVGRVSLSSFCVRASLRDSSQPLLFRCSCADNGCLSNGQGGQDARQLQIDTTAIDNGA